MASSTEIRKTIAIAALAVAAGSIPVPAAAVHNLSLTKSSMQAFLDCLGSHPSLFQRVHCSADYWFFDPPAHAVTGFELTVRYDATAVFFDSSRSGPLGVLSVGGDSPVPMPGIGTQALQLLPASGYRAGAPLPGSTLTYTDLNGVLTVNYTLADPVSVDENINFFVLAFQRYVPFDIDFANSTIGYSDTSTGGDFAQLGFGCTTSTGSNNCGSDHPASSATYHFDYVPEPASWLLLLAGFGMLGTWLRHRRPHAPPALPPTA